MCKSGDNGFGFLFFFAKIIIPSWKKLNYMTTMSSLSRCLWSKDMCDMVLLLDYSWEQCELIRQTSGYIQVNSYGMLICHVSFSGA